MQPLNETFFLDHEVLEHLAIGIGVTDSEGVFIYTNPRFEKMFAYEPCELLGQPGYILNAPEEEPSNKSREIFAAMNEKGRWSGEVYNIRKDGTPLWTRAKITAIDHSIHGKIWVGFQEDISKQKQIESRLIQTQKMEALGLLSCGVAHDFNNLIMLITGFSDLLIEDKSDDDPDKKLLSYIKDAGLNAKEIVQKMLFFGGQSKELLEPLNLEQLIDNSIAILSSPLLVNIDLKKQVERDLPDILGVTSEIHQVILNLFINACHAMNNEGGRLTVSLSTTETGDLNKQEIDKSESNFVVLSVKDNGVGMDQKTIDRIFEPFFSTKKVGQGSGLGLTITQEIIKRHNGFIKVNSNIGEGSDFRIYLPISRAAKEIQTQKKNGDADVFLD